MAVDKFGYRMCEKIKKCVKILLLEFLNEDYILHFSTSVQQFFLINCISTWKVMHLYSVL